MGGGSSSLLPWERPGSVRRSRSDRRITPASALPVVQRSVSERGIVARVPRVSRVVHTAHMQTMAARGVVERLQSPPVPRCRFPLTLRRRSSTDEGEVPDGFLCNISFERMVDPVVLTCSGFSFERKVLLDWLAIKMDCPITRRPCGKNAFVDNIALRKASEEWEKRRAKREAAKKAGDAANAILLKAAASFPKVCHTVQAWARRSSV